MAAPFAAARSIGFALTLTLLSAHLALAQVTDSFATLPQVIDRGTNVFVEDENGQRTKGKVVQLSDATLQLMTPGVSGRRVSFAPDQVRRVMKVDSRLNGFLIGAAAGAIPGILLGMGFSTYCSNEATSCPAAPAIVGTLFGLAGGGIGYAIDGAIDGQRLVYSRRPRGSISLRLRF